MAERKKYDYEDSRLKAQKFVRYKEGCKDSMTLISNHEYAPQVCIVPLSTKLKDNPVHVKLNPEDVKGYKLKAKSDFIPEDMQTVSKGKIRGKTGYIPKNSPVRDDIDRSLILQLDLLSAARKMIMEEVENGCENEEN